MESWQPTEVPAAVAAKTVSGECADSGAAQEPHAKRVSKSYWTNHSQLVMGGQKGRDDGLYLGAKGHSLELVMAFAKDRWGFTCTCNIEQRLLTLQQ